MKYKSKCQTVPFGKFKGQLYESLDDKYLEFLLSQGWVNNPVRSNAQAELDRRTSAKPTGTLKSDDPVFQVASAIDSGQGKDVARILGNAVIDVIRKHGLKELL